MAAGYPATINTAREAQLGADAAAEIVGEAKVDARPAALHGLGGFRLHAASSGPAATSGWAPAATGRPSQLHSPYYDFNDEALPLGVSYWARLVERLLPKAA